METNSGRNYENKRKVDRVYYAKNKDKIQQRSKKWYFENKKRASEYHHLRYLKKIEEIKKRSKNWRENNKQVSAEYRKMTKDKRNAYNREYVKANKVKILEQRRKSYVKNKGVLVQKYRIKKYGVTLEHFNTMLKEQSDSCAICKSNFKMITIKRMGKDYQRFDCNIDHDHKTGKVRKLLCGTCNTAIGLLNDSPILAKRVMRYLLQYQTNNMQTPGPGGQAEQPE